MTPTTRLTDGLIVALVLAVLIESAPAASPALAQETPAGGMGGNETTIDGVTTGNETETMDDGTETLDGDSMTDEGMATDSETTADDEMATEDGMDGDSMIGEGMDDGMAGEETMDDGTTSDGQPGFGVVVGLAALAGVAGFTSYRLRG